MADKKILERFNLEHAQLRRRAATTATDGLPQRIMGHNESSRLELQPDGAVDRRPSSSFLVSPSAFGHGPHGSNGLLPPSLLTHIGTSSEFRYPSLTRTTSTATTSTSNGPLPPPPPLPQQQCLATSLLSSNLTTLLQHISTNGQHTMLLPSPTSPMIHTTTPIRLATTQVATPSPTQTITTVPATVARRTLASTSPASSLSPALSLEQPPPKKVTTRKRRSSMSRATTTRSTIKRKRTRTKAATTALATKTKTATKIPPPTAVARSTAYTNTTTTSIITTRSKAYAAAFVANHASTMDVTYYPWDVIHKKWHKVPCTQQSIPPVPLKHQIHNFEDDSNWTTKTTIGTIPPSLDIALPRGGRLLVWKGLLQCRSELREELLHRVQYRRYTVQGNLEPRSHCLYHDQATAVTGRGTSSSSLPTGIDTAATNDPFPSKILTATNAVGTASEGASASGGGGGLDTVATTNAHAPLATQQSQPGYRYGNVTLLARPASELIHVPRLAHCLARRLCGAAATNDDDHDNGGEPFWNIGINPVLYRNGHDKMGFHADDDQGEQIILTALVEGPRRKIVIQPSAKVHAKDTWESTDCRIELWLEPGDVYQMDGEMQQHYVHAVPRVDNHHDLAASNSRIQHQRTSSEPPRMVVVMRRGNFKRYQRDTGVPVHGDPLYMEPKLVYQHGPLPGIHVGHVYRRTELMRLGAHLAAQRSVSGSSSTVVHTGCDAVILSGTRSDGLEWDAFYDLVYAVELRKGAGALVKSYQEALPIRIFRTNRIDARIKTITADGVKQRTPYTCQLYRYDGLYRVLHMKKPPVGEERTTPYLFHLQMANPGYDGNNPDANSAEMFHSQSSSKKCDIRLSDEADFSFTRPGYLGNRTRLSRSQFLFLLHLFTQRQPASTPKFDCLMNANDHTSKVRYLENAVRCGMPVLLPLLSLVRKCEGNSCIRKRSTMNATNKVKRPNTNGSKPKGLRRKALRYKAEKMDSTGMRTRSKSKTNVTRKRPAPATPTPSQEPNETVNRMSFTFKLSCNCRQFRCSICEKCSKGYEGGNTCHENPCRCPNGPTRGSKFKRRKRVSLA